MAQRKVPKLMVDPTGKRYRLVVFKVITERDWAPKVNGHYLPDEVSIMLDDDVAEIQGGERFITGYVPCEVFGEPG